MKPKWLIQALVGSAVLNIILVALLFFVMWRESTSVQTLPYRPSQLTVSPIDQTTYQQLAALSYEELVERLSDVTPLRGAYRLQQVALGLLVKIHEIDLQKAFGKQVKPVFFLDEALLFPKLKKRDYKQIQRYLQSHVTPFTAKGLFNRLPSSAPAFRLTEEYVQLETLIHRLIPACCQEPLLIALCQEAGWPLLEQLGIEQAQGADFRPERAKRFLVDALCCGSRQAAYLLVITSPGHRLEEYNDSIVERILSLMDVKTKEAESCCRHLLASTRSPSIQERARLYLGEKVRPTADPKFHIVQNGESLWLIAKQHHLTVDQLLGSNPAAAGMLRPGMKLVIP